MSADTLVLSRNALGPNLQLKVYFEAESELLDRKKVVNINIRDPSFTEKKF